jgi:hypothetical protein
MMPLMKTSITRLLALLLLHWIGAGSAVAQTTATPPSLEAERAKQEKIYQGRGELRLEGYVIDRSLSAYVRALPQGFAQSLANLGPEERWLDVGAGQGMAVLDYYAPEYDPRQAGRRERQIKKARSVAMSIEDRRTPRWQQTADTLEPNQLRYVFNKPLREYTTEELGRFQLITDVIGGFSYTENLTIFMEKVLSLLTVNGMFYTVAQDVRNEADSNQPFYSGEPFLSQIKNAAGNDIGICAWLKKISCIEVSCEYKSDWRPTLETYRIRKSCDKVSVPPLATERYVAGTPPERVFLLTSPASTPAAKP